jgi:hypothetical protein
MLCVHIASGQVTLGGIGKSTHVVSDAVRTFDWLMKHLPVEGPETLAGCEDGIHCPCGQMAAVTTSSDGKSGGFGIHAIATNASSLRTTGPVAVKTLEDAISKKFKHAANHVMKRANKNCVVNRDCGYDTFLDYNTGFWVADLDPYIREFTDEWRDIDDRIQNLPIEWKDVPNNKTYYSLLVQVPNTYVLLEFMSGQETLLSKNRYRAPQPRFVFEQGATPESTFLDLSPIIRGKPIMRAARISQYTSDVARDAIFYSTVFDRKVDNKMTHFAQEPGGDVERGEPGGRFPEIDTLVLDFKDMAAQPNYLQLHLIQRRPTDSQGDNPTIPDIERMMNSVHEETIRSETCGQNQWMDMHFSINTANWRLLENVVPKIQKLGYKYVIRDGYFERNDDQDFNRLSKYASVYKLWAITPNGLSVQVRGMERGLGFETDPPEAPADEGLCNIGSPSCGAIYQQYDVSTKKTFGFHAASTDLYSFLLGACTGDDCVE